jgi:iron-sulfur cluster assembly protein
VDCPDNDSGGTRVITVTSQAEKELRRLMTEQDPNIALRVFVSPGGCSGMSYGMAFDDEQQDGDQVIEHDGIRISVDEMSAMYLEGSEIDYVDQLMGGGFTIHNPNAVKSCACGHSFDTGSDAATARSCS